jgi:hypothetical protein
MNAVATPILAVLGQFKDGTSAFVAGAEKYFTNGLLRKC